MVRNSRRKTRRGTGLKRLFGLLALLGVIAVAAGVYAVVLVPHAGFRGEVFVDIPRGVGTKDIAAMLEEQGVVRSRWLFLAARAARPQAPLQAGEYRFHEMATAWEVYQRLARGDVFYLDLIVPEGSNTFDIARLAAGLGIMSEEEFLAAARDPSMIRDLAPRAATLEGYLFPSTYQLSRRTAPEELCRRMTAEFRRVWQGLGSPGDAHQVVTMASLVEKETGVGEERDLVSSVFHNRLKAGMRLQCDPTTIYAALMEGRYRGTIYQSDLQSKHPYNTYQNEGLPPGPIANPGLAALKAALAPAESPYLYFVMRPDSSGGHVFSETLQQHEAAVRRLRQQEQNRSNGKKGVEAGPANGAAGGKARSGR